MDILAERGWIGLYAGLGLALTRSVVANMMNLWGQELAFLFSRNPPNFIHYFTTTLAAASGSALGSNALDIPRIYQVAHPEATVTEALLYVVNEAPAEITSGVFFTAFSNFIHTITTFMLGDFIQTRNPALMRNTRIAWAGVTALVTFVFSPLEPLCQKTKRMKLALPGAAVPGSSLLQSVLGLYNGSLALTTSNFFYSLIRSNLYINVMAQFDLIWPAAPRLPPPPAQNPPPAPGQAKGQPQPPAGGGRAGGQR